MYYDPDLKPEVKLLPEQKLLLDAADLLERKGWIRYALYSEKGYCSLGALDASLRNINLSGPPAPQATYMNAVNRLAKKVGTLAISAWNDKPTRTKEEVISAFRKAAE